MTGAWQCYRCVLRAQSPLHIGWHRLGYVERTRTYIPGRNVWGALAGTVAGILYRNDGVPEMYRKAEQAFERSLRFTYFYRGGELRTAAAEADMIGSRVAAAIDPSRFAAEEGALHEMEYLVERTNGGRAPVEWIGYLFSDDAELFAAVEEALRDCRMGAERSYGWGRTTGTLEAHTGGVFGFSWRPGKDGFVLEREKESYELPAHLRCSDDQVGLTGELEVVAGRGWASGARDRGGPGQDVWGARLCWAPLTRGGDSAPGRFRIDTFGFWEVAPADALLS